MPRGKVQGKVSTEDKVMDLYNHGYNRKEIAEIVGIGIARVVHIINLSGNSVDDFLPKNKEWVADFKAKWEKARTRILK